jgi:hypothetical protein
MSTNLQPPRRIASAVKTISDYAEKYHGSDKIEEQRFANVLNEFLFNVYDMVNPDPEKTLSVNELEKALFSAIVDENIASHKVKWADAYSEDPHLELKNKTKYGSVQRNLHVLGTLKYPQAKGKGVGRLAAAVWDIAGDLDNKESPLVKEICKLEQQLYKFTVTLHPSYPEALPEEKQAMMDVLSMRTWGDRYYMVENAARGAMNGLETDVKYSSGDDRKIYPEQMFAFLAQQITTPTGKLVLITEGQTVDGNLPSLSSLTGEKISIQSDIPSGDRDTAFNVARVMNELNDRLQRTPSTQFWPYKDNDLDVDGVNQLKERVDYMTSSLNRMLASESEGYRKEINFNHHKDNDSSQSFE